MQNKILLAGLLLLVTGHVIFAATGTAPPAINQKSPPPSDWVKVDSTTFHFDFFVPKQWTQQGTDGSIKFDLTPAKMKLLDQTITEARADFSKNPDTKILTDKAATLGGRPAWIFELENTQTIPVRPVSPNLPVRQVKMVVRSYQITYVHGLFQFEFNFAAEANAYTSDLVAAKRVIDSLVWTDNQP